MSLANEKEFQKALEEREHLRPHRIRNYRIKFRDGCCTEPGCGAEFGLVVTKVGRGDGDDAFTTRCRPHLKGRVSPGQWVEA
jgi:hypothetical protein